MSKVLYDLSILEEMVYGDKEFMRELVQTFIEFAPIDAEELRVYAKEKNWAETSKKAHKLKSSIRTIGVTSLSDVILAIEEDTKNETNLDTICDHIESFSTILKDVIESLKGETFIATIDE